MVGGAALIPTALERAVRQAARHDRAEPGTVLGFLRLRYRSAAPLHVGTGALALWPAGAVPGGSAGAPARRGGEGAPQAQVPVREAFRRNGIPALPGSTLRGALRQRHARITRSCLGRSGGEPARRGERPSAPSLLPCRGRELCPTCALFGGTGFRSRVRVNDGLAEQGAQIALAALPARGGRRGGERGGRPRGRPGGERERGRGERGARPERPAPAGEWVEVIPADTQIHVELGVRNLRLDELGALLGALGCDPLSALACGGGQRAGFGRLYAEGLEVELYQPNGALAQADVASWRAAFEQSADRWPAGEAALLRDFGDR
jgi:hypothetical protein